MHNLNGFSHTRWIMVAIVGTVLVGPGCGGDDAPPAEDAGGDVATGTCTRVCDDGAFCNGVEICDPENEDADRDGCVEQLSPCDTGCDEDADMCLEACEDPDVDGDGVDSIECGGTDCDDTDPNRYPGNPEVCDVGNIDEDCDPNTLGDDVDGDGFYSDECCNGEVCGTDCNDDLAGVNPGATDSCGGGDQDCDGDIDEEPDSIFFRDQDSDNFGVDDDTLAACAQPTGYAARGGDCSDDPFEAPPEHPANEVNPGASEICNLFDDDCDGEIDDGLSCACDRPGEESDCGYDPDDVVPGAGSCRLGTQRCQDDGMFTVCAGAVPPSDEVCDGEDDDCDGRTDEGSMTRCYVDNDGDGYAREGVSSTMECTCPAGTTARAPEGADIDCDDTVETTYPGAPELCNLVDDDCDPATDHNAEDRDRDGHTSSSYDGCVSGVGTFPRDDCNDNDDRVFPGQTQYFTDHRCDEDECACSTGCAARDPRGICTPCAFGVNPESYDFNCDRRQSRRPSGPLNCGICFSGASCLGSFPRYSGSPRCGSTVTYINCGTGFCSSSCTGSGPNTSQPLGCR